MPRPARRPAAGFTLLELMLALAVLTVLLAVLLPGRGLLDTARAAQVRQELETLRQAADSWLARGRLDYTGVSVSALQSEGLLPPGRPGTTPWGGSYTVGPNGSDPTQLTVTATGLPAALAVRLRDQLLQAGHPATAVGGTLTVVF